MTDERCPTCGWPRDLGPGGSECGDAFHDTPASEPIDDNVTAAGLASDMGMVEPTPSEFDRHEQWLKQHDQPSESWMVTRAEAECMVREGTKKGYFEGFRDGQHDGDCECEVDNWGATTKKCDHCCECEARVREETERCATVCDVRAAFHEREENALKSRALGGRHALA